MLQPTVYLTSSNICALTEQNFTFGLEFNNFLFTVSTKLREECIQPNPAKCSNMHSCY